MSQRFKSVYFSDLPSDRKRSVNIGFGAEHTALADRVRGLPSATLRNALGVTSYEELRKQAASAGQAVNSFCIERLRIWTAANPSNDDARFPDPLQVTFAGGKGETLHDWFPYLEGFSSLFVEEVLHRYAPKAKTVLDPFAGLGTTPLTAMRLGLTAYYTDVNPLCRFLIGIKRDVLKQAPRTCREQSKTLREIARSMREILAKHQPDRDLARTYPAVFGESVFFEAKQFDAILRLRAFLDAPDINRTLRRLITVAAVRALVPGSLLIRRGDLRFKNEKEKRLLSRNYLSEVTSALEMIASDLECIPRCDGAAIEVSENAIGIGAALKEDVHSIITSPPYLNGTNYFRNAKLELWFLRKLQDKSDLGKLRFKAITAGINDVTSGKTSVRAGVFRDDELQRIVSRLQKESYDPRIADMVSTYFSDMWLALSDCASRLVTGGTLALDIGDSLYGDVHVPTDVILSRMLSTLGLSKVDDVCLRQRASRGGFPLRETLLVFNKDASQ